MADGRGPGDDAPSLWRLILEDWRVNDRDWTRPGFRAVAVARFGAWRIRQRPAIRRPLYVVYRALHRYVRNHYGIEVHGTTALGRRVKFSHQGAIVVHEQARIGDDCIVSQGVTIGAAISYEEAPELGRGVSVGAGAVIVGKVRVGDGVRVGPNAVVMRDVPAGSVVVAPQSRIVRAPDRDED